MVPVLQVVSGLGPMEAWLPANLPQHSLNAKGLGLPTSPTVSTLRAEIGLGACVTPSQAQCGEGQRGINNGGGRRAERVKGAGLITRLLQFRKRAQPG